MGAVKIDQIKQSWLRELGVQPEWLVPNSVGDRAASMPPPVPVSDPSQVILKVNQTETIASIKSDESSTDTRMGLQASISACQACARSSHHHKNVDVYGRKKVAVLVDTWHEADQWHDQKQHLLRNMLAAIGLDIETHVLVLPVLRCWAPDGTPDGMYSEAQACLGFLKQQLQTSQPMAILALGGLPAKVLLANQTPARGKLYKNPLGLEHTSGLVSFPLHHLLNHPTDKAKAWQDLLLFKELIL